MSANLIELPSPDSSGNPNELGSGVQIGDGYTLTAGHVVYQFNDDNVNRAVVGLSNQVVYWDPRSYYSQYVASITNLSNPLPTPDSGRTISNQFVEPGLAASDIVMIGHSGNVSSGDAGL